MQIKVQVKSIYGVDKTYPICSRAQIFAKLAGTKTLTEHTLECIDALGCTIEKVGPDSACSIVRRLNHDNMQYP